MRNKRLKSVRREYLDAWMALENTLAVFFYIAGANGTLGFGEHIVKGDRKHN
jgi:hypothetical protein